MVVKQLNRIASVPVGVRFLGRVINPLGEPIDGKGSIQSEAFYPIERPAPEINQRANVHKIYNDTPLQPQSERSKRRRQWVGPRENHAGVKFP